MVLRKFGLVGGKSVTAYTEAIEKELGGTGVFTKTWQTIDELQSDVHKNGLKAIDELNCILIIDKGFNANPNNADAMQNFGKFNMLQNLFLTREMYGVHLILYTADAKMFKAANAFFEGNSNAKYKGTNIRFNESSKGSFTVSGIANILKEPFVKLTYGEQDTDEIARVESDKKAKKELLAANRNFYKLLGEKETLEATIEQMSRKLKNTNAQLVEYATAIQEDNLDFVAHDLEQGIGVEANKFLDGN